MARSLDAVANSLRVQFFKLTSPQAALLDLLQRMVIDPDPTGALVRILWVLARLIFCFVVAYCVF